MAELRENRKDNDNLASLSEWLKMVGVITAVVVAAIMIVSGLISFDAWQYNKVTLPKENTRVDEFNALPLESRQAIIEWEELKEYDTETYKLPPSEAKSTTPWFVVHPNLAAAVLVLIVSAVTFFVYCIINCEQYYLCDFPHTKLGWTLFVVMFVGWLCLAVSWVRMHIKEGDNLRERRERWKAEAEAEKNSTPDEEVAVPEQETGRKPPVVEEAHVDTSKEIRQVTAIRPAVEAQSEEGARANYLAFVTMNITQQRELEIQNAEAEVQSKEASVRESDCIIRVRLQELQRLLTSGQAELERLKAELRALKEKPLPDATELQHNAEAEWAILRQMQGVYYVGHDKYDDDGDLLSDDIENLVVMIRVCIPYEGRVYDVGDYKFWLARDGYLCKRLRSGVRENASSYQPDYSDSDDFCFGSRDEVITDYLEKGCFAEALALIIDGLHYVNETDRDAIPACFYAIDTEKDPVVEHYYAVGGGN